MDSPNEAPGKIIYYLGACLIAAIRLAREEQWDNSARVASRLADAISLARLIYEICSPWESQIPSFVHEPCNPPLVAFAS